MMWRAPLALNRNKLPTYAALDALIVSTSLMSMIDFGFLPVVPLDLHPSAGLVLLGRSRDLDEIAENLTPTVSISTEVETLEALFAGGGGVAL
jgi:hypothetical protein